MAQNDACDGMYNDKQQKKKDVHVEKIGKENFNLMRLFNNI